MIFGLFTLAVAIFISGVSAFYSVTGLTAIFAAAFWPIVIMGSALEIGKITATVWLHKYWHRANWQFKAYLIPAIVILMIITSMGTYGYLAKAHMDQNVTVGDSAAQVSILDEKINTEKGNIESAKKALGQMDNQVDQMLSRTTDDKGTNRAVQIRKQQAGERKNLQKEITEAQKHIAELQNERAPLAAQSRKIEAEVGPIRYIAALIYGDNPNADLLERAVRWVIILLVLVFDPLALVLILAAEQTIEWARADRKAKKAEGWHQEWVPDTEAWPPYELDDGPLTDEQITKIKQEANVDDDIEMKEFFADGKELAKEIDANDGFIVKQHHNPEDVNPVDVTVEEESILDKHPYLKKPWSWVPKTSDVPVLEGEEMWAQEAIDSAPSVEETFNPKSRIPVPTGPDPEPSQAVTMPVIDGPHDPAPINRAPTNQVVIPDLSIQATADSKDIHAGFGIRFPTSPDKGDMFLRVDQLPSKLFKWNGSKWIEVDKDFTDSFAYDEKYIKHLVGKLESGEYDVELLTSAEQEQVSRYLQNANTNK